MKLEVDALDAAGRGVARNAGKVVFVEGALAGELVEARLLESRSKFDLARSFGATDCVNPKDSDKPIAALSLPPKLFPDGIVSPDMFIPAEIMMISRSKILTKRIPLLSMISFPINHNYLTGSPAR